MPTPNPNDPMLLDLGSVDEVISIATEAYLSVPDDATAKEAWTALVGAVMMHTATKLMPLITGEPVHMELSTNNGTPLVEASVIPDSVEETVEEDEDEETLTPEELENLRENYVPIIEALIDTVIESTKLAFDGWDSAMTAADLEDPLEQWRRQAIGMLGQTLKSVYPGYEDGE